MRSYWTGFVRMAIYHCLMKQNAKHLLGKLFRISALLSFSYNKQVVVESGRHHRRALLILTIVFTLSMKIVDRIQIIQPIDLFVKNTVTFSDILMTISNLRLLYLPTFFGSDNNFYFLSSAGWSAMYCYVSGSWMWKFLLWRSELWMCYVWKWLSVELWQGWKLSFG